MKDNVREIAVLLLYIAEKLQGIKGAAADEALAHIDAAAGHIAALIAKPPARRRGRRLRRISRRRGAATNKSKPAASEPEPPKVAAPETAKTFDPAADASTLYDGMLAECKKRGYDPDMMLGLAKALPKVDFVKNPGKDYPNPVWRGPESRRKPSQKPTL